MTKKNLFLWLHLPLHSGEKKHSNNVTRRSELVVQSLNAIFQSNLASLARKKILRHFFTAYFQFDTTCCFNSESKSYEEEKNK